MGQTVLVVVAGVLVAGAAGCPQHSQDRTPSPVATPAAPVPSAPHDAPGSSADAAPRPASPAVAMRDLVPGKAGDPRWGSVAALTVHDGRVHLITDSGRVVRLLDASLREIAHASYGNREIHALAVSPDGTSVALARADGVVGIVDALDLHEQRTVTMNAPIMRLPDARGESVDPFGPLRGVGYTAAGKLVTVAERGAICFEDVQTCYDAMPSITGVLGPNGPAPFAVVDDRAVFAWRSSKLASLRPGTPPIMLGKEHGIPDNRARVLAASSTGWVAIAYNDDSFELLTQGARITVRMPDVSAFGFSPNGAYLAVASRQGIARYDLRCITRVSKDLGQPVVTRPQGGTATAIIATDHGQVVAGHAKGLIVASDPDPGASAAPRCTP